MAKCDSRHAALATRDLDAASRRSAARVFIVDALTGDIVLAPATAEPSIDAIDEIKNIVARVLWGGVPETGSVFAVGEAIVRVSNLRGTLGAHLCVVVERSRGGGLGAMTARFALTPRETDVVKLLLEGASTHAIAEALGIAESTVGDHVKRIAMKTEERTRAGIVARLLRSF